jgi:hypothetical protein
MAEIEIDEVFGLMSNVASKVASDNAVPRRSFAVVESSLDVLGNVLLDGEFAHGFLSNIDSLSLHVVRHVCGFDSCFKLIATPSRRRRHLLVGHVCDFGQRGGGISVWMIAGIFVSSCVSHGRRRLLRIGIRVVLTASLSHDCCLACQSACARDHHRQGGCFQST